MKRDNEIRPEDYAEALKVLREGGTLLYPTDTVWGLGCDATDPVAVKKIFDIKRRDDSKSLVLLVSDEDMLARYVKDIPEIALQLIEVNDKPMTIIYPGAVVGDMESQSKYALAPNTVAVDGTVGIRIPMMDWCRNLIHKLGRPIVSTSANISGEATPRRFSEISEEIKSAVDYVCNPSLEAQSTGKSSSIIKVGTDFSIEVIRK